MNEKITSISELAEYAKGQVVKFPDFAEGQPFVARIRRPSITSLVSNNKIPNSLLDTASKLFSGEKGAANNPNAIKDLSGIFEALCEASFIEPSFEEIKESGISLTDDQLIFLFNYSQAGVKALDSFREKPKSNAGFSNEPNVQRKAVRDNKNRK